MKLGIVTARVGTLIADTRRDKLPVRASLHRRNNVAMREHSPSTTARLTTYKSKRDFRTSPEPAGKPQKRGRGGRGGKGGRGKKSAPPVLRFCVQKHLASHLHYDFRLEHQGVLLSWAVPKGPSLRPSEKRLAMKVEDHPLEYRDFEGVIPEGYGAGIVMVWDQGEWFPEVDDVDAALAEGDLKFRLEGVKLKGSWALIRTRGRAGDDRSWLLIKHRDDWAGDVDVEKAAPLSVKSFGDFADILAADKPDVWKSNRPAAGGNAGKLLREIIKKADSRR